MEITLLHQTDEEHLNQVKMEMHQLGPPKIKAVWEAGWETWVALEGTHRITAAVDLGLPVIIDEVEYSQEAWIGSEEEETDLTIADIVDSAWMSRRPVTDGYVYVATNPDGVPQIV
jgi:hypothetical protein